MDSLAFVHIHDSQVRQLARGDAFKNPLMRKLFYFFHMLPYGVSGMGWIPGKPMRRPLTPAMISWRSMVWWASIRRAIASTSDISVRSRKASAALLFVRWKIQLGDRPAHRAGWRELYRCRKIRQTTAYSVRPGSKGTDLQRTVSEEQCGSHQYAEG